MHAARETLKILALFVATAAIAVSCERRDVTAPQRTVVRAPAAAGSRPSFALDDSPDEASATASSDSTYGGAPPPGSPPVVVGYYAHPTVVQATASGNLSWSPAHYGITSSGSIGAAGSDSVTGHAAVLASWVNGGGSQLYNFGTQRPWAGSHASSVTTYLTVSDTVTVARGPNGAMNSGLYYCGPEYGNLCIKYTGTATLSLNRVSATASLAADSTTVSVGSTVKFTHRYSPTFVLNGTDTVWLPRSVTARIWTPDDTAIGGDSAEAVDSTTACGVTSDSTCSRLIEGPGTMTYVFEVNGRQESHSVHINAVCAPVHDSLGIADDARVRHQFAIALTASGVGGDVSSRVEHGGYIYTDPSDGRSTLEDIPSASQNLCEYKEVRPAPSGPPNTSITGRWHTHPYDPTTEVIPSGLCPHAMQGGHPYPGPSPNDENMSKADGYPSYIVDEKQMYLSWGPGDSRNRSYSRVVGACHRY